MAQRRTKGEQRERSVVAAAAELIAEHGLARLRMVDVAERAEMSVGHVTYYFPSKSQLLVRAITHSEEEFHAEVCAALARHSTPWSRLVTLIELAAAQGPRDPGWLLWFEVWANAAVDEEVATAQAQLDGWWRRQMAEIIDDGRSLGDFTTGTPERVVAVLSALTDGLSVQLALGTGEDSRDDVVDLVVTMARELLGVDR